MGFGGLADRYLFQLQHPQVCQRMALVRETLLGDGRCGERCEAAELARPDESLRQTPYLSLRQHADEPVAISTHRICTHLRENGLGSLEVAASLASSHFQHVGWK